MGSRRIGFDSSNYGMGSMKQHSRQELTQLKKEVGAESAWEEVSGFKTTKPTSIRLSPRLIWDLEKIVHLRGEKSCQTLLKRSVTERVKYEKELIDPVKARKAV